VIRLGLGDGTGAAQWLDIPFERIATMNDLDPAQLTTVVGGASKTKTDDLTLQLTTLQDSIKSIASTDKNGGGNQTFMMLAMMIAMRPPATTVVAAGGGPVAAAPGAFVNIRTRVRF
jgi:hypothetical protein